jgi:hypothetical protein
LKTAKKLARGARGNVVASRNRFGDYDRERVSPDAHPTPARLRVWSNMGVLSDLWNEIGQARRIAWHRLADELHSRPRLGQFGRLDGRLLFLKLNRVLATCGREPLLDPPPLPELDQNPVAEFTIPEIQGRIALQLRLKRTPTEEIMLFASPPRPPGRSYNSDYAFLCLLSPPHDGLSEFTDQYLTKLKEWRKLKPDKYHVPLPGAKIFLRAVQQVNGWQNERGMFQAAAFVPGTRAAADMEQRRRPGPNRR